MGAWGVLMTLCQSQDAINYTKDGKVFWRYMFILHFVYIVFVTNLSINCYIMEMTFMSV